MSSIGSGGSWKQILPGTAVGSGGVWKPIEGMWVGAGGVWKQFFVQLTLSLTTISLTGSVPNTSGFTVKRNGVLQTVLNNSPTDRPTQWVSEGRSATVGDAFEVRWDYVGDFMGTGTGWLALTSDRTWSRSGAGSASGTLTIRDVATSGAEFSVSATATVFVS